MPAPRRGSRAIHSGATGNARRRDLLKSLHRASGPPRARQSPDVLPGRGRHRAVLCEAGGSEGARQRGLQCGRGRSGPAGGSPPQSVRAGAGRGGAPSGEQSLDLLRRHGRRDGRDLEGRPATGPADAGREALGGHPESDRPALPALSGPAERQPVKPRIGSGRGLLSNLKTSAVPVLSPSPLYRHSSPREAGNPPFPLIINILF